jgi:hypothetical protein
MQFAGQALVDPGFALLGIFRPFVVGCVGDMLSELGASEKPGSSGPVTRQVRQHRPITRVSRRGACVVFAALWSKRRRRGRSSQFLKSAGRIVVTDEPLDLSDPVGSVLIPIKSMEGLPARTEIDAHWRRSHAPSTWARVINSKKRSATHHRRTGSPWPRWNFRYGHQATPSEVTACASFFFNGERTSSLRL